MTTIAELFAGAGVTRAGSVQWGAEVPLDAPGVYVVALTDDAEAVAGVNRGPIDQRRVEELLEVRPETAVDGAAADIHSLTRRLQEMWVPGEPAVYIGMAGVSVRQRINQFYSTRIGARAPHAGGWPVKMIDQMAAPLWIHYGATPDSDLAEAAMIDCYVRGVPNDVAAKLVDPAAPLPFANLTFPHGRRKQHGMSGVRAPRPAGGLSAPRPRTQEVVNYPAREVSSAGANVQLRGQRRRTQNITANDIKAGQVRIPGISKDVFPTERGDVEVRIAGESHIVRWDPRVAGNRSGILRFGVAVMRAHFTPGGQREIIEGGGVYEFL
ncbi:hypothetical protein ACWIBQ_13420 [Microbacterium keratanolyticum]